MDNIIERINKIENEIKELKRFQDITDYKYKNMIKNKKPYKCPVCDGSKKRYVDPARSISGFEAMIAKRDIHGLYYFDCESCEGKGIIWG